MKQTAYQQGFETGFSDGKHQKTMRPKPALFKALMSDAYMSNYKRGYRDGHFAGIRKARKQELRRIREVERANDHRDR